MVTNIHNFYSMIHRKYPTVDVRARDGVIRLSGPLSTADNNLYAVKLQEDGWYSAELPKTEYKCIISAFPSHISSVNSWLAKYPFITLANKKHFSNIKPSDILIPTDKVFIQNEGIIQNTPGNYYMLELKNITPNNTGFFNKIPYIYYPDTESLIAIVKSSNTYVTNKSRFNLNLNIYNTLLLYITDLGSNEEEFNYLLQQIDRSHLTKQILLEAFLSGKFFEVLQETPTKFNDEPF